MLEALMLAIARMLEALMLEGRTQVRPRMLVLPLTPAVVPGRAMKAQPIPVLTPAELATDLQSKSAAESQSGSPAEQLEQSSEQLPVLYRDEQLLIVNKPSGMIVHRGWANDSITALKLARDQAGCWVYAAHRLDRATSGILVFGLNSDIARELQKQFSERTVKKAYLALVRGWCPSEALINHPLAREKGAEKREAITKVQCLTRFELPTSEAYPRRYSWVKAWPETGRAHQIRRHLKHIDHPIIGDVRYGKGQHNRFFREHLQLHRMALHAQQLELKHPLSGETLHLRCSLPVALQRVTLQLQAWAES